MCLYVWIYKHGLQAVVWRVQQWLCSDGKATHPGVVHSGEPGVLAGLQCMWNPKKKSLLLIPVKGCLSSRMDGFDSQTENKQGKGQAPIHVCPFMWAATKRCSPDFGCVCWLQCFRFRVGLPTQIIQSRKCCTQASTSVDPTSVIKLLGFSWFQIYAVKLTTEMYPHS